MRFFPPHADNAVLRYIKPHCITTLDYIKKTRRRLSSKVRTNAGKNVNILWTDDSFAFLENRRRLRQRTKKIVWAPSDGNSYSAPVSSFSSRRSARFPSRLSGFFGSISVFSFRSKKGRRIFDFCLPVYRCPVVQSVHFEPVMISTTEKGSGLSSWPKKVAESVRFELTRRCRQTVFKISCLSGLYRNLADDKWHQNPCVDGDFGVFLFEPPQNLFPASISFLMRFLMKY